MTTDLTFITNEEDNKLVDRFAAFIKDSSILIVWLEAIKLPREFCVSNLMAICSVRVSLLLSLGYLRN
ncbi:MAG: hypothetical protein AEth_00739 [Candidatus Argoarchaeum ethanivorans]|uniref:Uncharacterized protein n=1 Tax=Candidatus Argoarchaeum ethanivorans TaxID=2608793 RepID=A0A8B3S2B6_9EURY|nr:MAG: hypothetical protein AEth_00739 [Candidatus Argoarchaeum ethanivorans]